MASSPQRGHRGTAIELKELLSAERAGRPFLVFRDGAGFQQIRMLASAQVPVTIGRLAETDVSLVWDEQVSRWHAQLEPIGSEWAVIDEGLSTNGTFLNGRRIVGRQRLADGDVLRLGHSYLTFRHPAQATLAPTVRAGDLPAVSELSATRRRILLALCRPLKEREGFVTTATNQQIAAEVFLGVDAVKTHLRVLYQRFGLDDLPQNQKRTKLAELALEVGLVSRREL